MSKDIAIIIPVYNAVSWIDACMEQLLSQRKLPDEIIFVDDASTDETVSRCAAWQRKYPEHVRIIRLCTNSGPGIARNAGMAACRSEYITFMDVDDRLSQHFISTLYDCITAKTLDVAVCGIDVISDSASKKVLPQTVFNVSSLLNQSILLCSTFNKIYRTNFIREGKIRFSRCRIGEDMAFAVKLCSLSPRVGGVPLALYQYIRRPGSLTGALKLRREIFVALDDLYAFLRRTACPSTLLSAYRRLCLLHGMYYPLRLLLRSRRSLPLFQLVDELRFYLVTTLQKIKKSYEQ